MATDILPEIIDNAKGPKQVTGDAGSVEQHNPKDLIEVDRYAKSNDAAVANSRRGLRITKLVMPGSI